MLSNMLAWNMTDFGSCAAPDKTTFSYARLWHYVFGAFLWQLQIDLFDAHWLHCRRGFFSWPMFLILQARLSATPAVLLK